MTSPKNNFWHQRFDQESYYYGTQPNDFLREQLATLPANGKILSIGEGEGRNAVYLAQQGFEVTAIDGAASGLAKAQKLAAERGVHINTQCVDLNDYEFKENRWDGIIIIFCHLPPALRQRVHEQVVRALKPNGICLMEVYRPEQLAFGTGGPSNVDMLYSKETLQKDLQGLKMIRLENVERLIQEGEGHNGQSAVVQVVAKKN